MKRLSELMAIAIQHSQNPEQNVTWFINYSGHVKLLEIRYYPEGYTDENWESAEKFSEYLDKDLGIGMAIQFIEKHLTRLS